MNKFVISVIFCASFSMAADYYLSPAGAGKKDGVDKENALEQSELLRVVNEVMQPGDRLLIGSGVYSDISLQIKKGGLKGKPVIIVGVDDGQGVPLFKAGWSVDQPDKGATAISIDSGVSHLEISNLRLEGYVFGVHARATNGKTLRTNLSFKNIRLNDFRYGFYLSDCRYLSLEDCVLKRYTKHGFRLDAGCSKVQIKRCTADCTGGDREWEKKTELFPFGFLLNNKGGGCTEVAFEDCLAINNLMPLQKTNYKNGDGFVVEGNAYDVSFTRCRSVNNQDGGFDLKVPDVKLKNCAALRNSRNFRIWNTGSLDNCIAAGGGCGLWNNGGPVTVTRSTFCNISGAAVQTDDSATDPVTLIDCIISGVDRTMHNTGRGAVNFKECIVVEKGGDIKDPAFVKPAQEWDGLGDAMNSVTYPDKGYRGKIAGDDSD